MSIRIFILALFLCIPFSASAAVVINEIAWMGTTVSSSNEWIELANTGSDKVSIDGWTLSIEGKKDIALSGSIDAGGFYLIERTDDTTVPTITADLISSFGSGISNTGAILSLKDLNGNILDRVDGSQAWLIGGNQAGDNTTKDTAQRGPNAWFTGAPTPRAANTGVAITQKEQQTKTTSAADAPTQTSNTSAAVTSSFPVEPQIFTDAGPAALTVSTGATVVFTGRVWGLKKEPIENARMAWSFGDGGILDGTSVSHVFYYPGEYTVVLDAASGFYAASDRIRVTAVTPAIVLRTGGDAARSFVALENHGNDELDLSGWQIESADKNFIIPKNTFVAAHKTLTFPSEVTGLMTPEGAATLLSFPNGTHVALKGEEVVRPALPTYEEPLREVAPAVAPRVRAPIAPAQQAAIADAFANDPESVVDGTTTPVENSMWPWYTGVAIFGALALLALRFIRQKSEEEVVKEKELTANDFKIEEEEDIW